jgi:galactokinase
MDYKEIKNNFNKSFGGGAEPRLFFAPGRVNLIGEHTDYNGGYVFPCALSLGAYGAARKRDDNVIRLADVKFSPAEVTVTTDDLSFNPEHRWANYVKGVVCEIKEMGCDIGGFDLFIQGNIPSSAGLSSSASVELLVFAALNNLFNLQIGPVEGALLCQRAENRYIGVNCGVMDQFASAMGKKEHAVLLNCASLEYKYVPLALNGHSIIIANTNNKRGLTDSKYNERRAECEEALADLQAVCDIANLCALSSAGFEAHAHVIKNPVARNRAAHAVYENARAQEAVKALEAGNLPAFGKLMNASHVSLRDLYEVTGPELDALAEAAWACEGVVGSRMTGAGFGGCTVSIVQNGMKDIFIEKVSKAYKDRTGLTADFYIAETGNGAGEI